MRTTKTKLFGILFLAFTLTLNSCNNEKDVVPIDEPKEYEEKEMDASKGGNLITSDDIQFNIPANALTTSGKVGIGRTGQEPRTVPNTYLEVVGDPISFSIPGSDPLIPLQIIYPNPSTSLSREDMGVLLFDGEKYLPMEFEIADNKILVSIDVVNTDLNEGGRKEVIGSLALITVAILVDKNMPAKYYGLKNATDIMTGGSSQLAMNSTDKTLILIHGINSNPKSCWENKIPQIQQLTNPKYKNVWTFGYDGRLPIADNAQKLKDELKKYNPTKVDIVAHSMGGLVSRYMIENLGESNRVNKLVTLGTPHLGSPIASYIRVIGGALVTTDGVINGFAFGVLTQGLGNMIPNSGFMRSMASEMPENEEYFLIAAENDGIGWHKLIPTSNLIPGPDDGFVSVTSAKGVSGAKNIDPILINVGNAHSAMTSNDTVFRRVREFLQDSSPTNVIVCSTNESGNSDIWTMNLNGTNKFQLTTHIGYDFAPSWSPDGEKIAFISDKSGSNLIWIMNADGTNKKQLINDPGYFHEGVSWSNDGTGLYYSRGVNGSGCSPCPTMEIWRINADGTNAVQITNDAFRDLSPYLSPDGQKISFTKAERAGDCCNQTDVCTMNTDGSNLQRIASTPDTYDWGAGGWSPDGNKILYLLAADLYSMHKDGSNKTLLASNVGSVSYTADGKQIVYQNLSGEGGADLWIMNADGSEKKPILQTAFSEEYLDVK